MNKRTTETIDLSLAYMAALLWRNLVGKHISQFFFKRYYMPSGFLRVATRQSFRERLDGFH